MALRSIDLSEVDGKSNDLLLYSKSNSKQKKDILNFLNNQLSPTSNLWQSIQKNGRSRLVIGPEGTGLIGGRGNKIVPSIPWEGKEWKIIRQFVLKNVKKLEKKNIIPKNSVPTVLINYYPNGSSGIIYHQDRTDNCLGTIVSYTFGPKDMKRNFLIRNITTGNEASIALEQGDTLVMTGSFNDNFQHAVETIKKSNPMWNKYRYNITLRFITSIKPKSMKKTNKIWTKDENGVIRFPYNKYKNHRLGGIRFIPTAEIANYSDKFLIRYKNWGNVGDYLTEKEKIISLANKKISKNVQSLPDFYIYIPTNRCLRYIVKLLEEIKNYFSWKFPRNSKFKVGKIELNTFIDILFNFDSGSNKYQIPLNYTKNIVKLGVNQKQKKIVKKRYGFYVSECGIVVPKPIEKKGIIWAKNCAININGSKEVLPGLNLQYPYARWLVEGKKTIETRTWNINPNLLNKYIAVIETPGKLGKRNGVDKAKIIGYVKFSGVKEYTDNNSWISDTRYHLCDFNLNGTKI